MGFDLPAAGFISDASRTEGEIKTSFDQMVGFAKQNVGGGAQVSFSIVSGVIAPTSPWVNVDTEGAASLDTLTHIDPAFFVEGNLIILFLTNAAHHVVIQNNAGGSGQISTDRAGDIKLTDGNGGLGLICKDIGGGVLGWIVLERLFNRGTERLQTQKFGASDNFIVPSLIEQIYTMGCGAGGAGGEGGDDTNDGNDGGDGGDTVLTGHITYSGGAGGKGGKSKTNGSQGGEAGAGGNHGQNATATNHRGVGGSFTASQYGEAGAGAFGGLGAPGTEGGGGGGGGVSRINNPIEGPFGVTPGDVIAVTIGAGATGGTGGSAGGAGASTPSGLLIILW